MLFRYNKIAKDTTKYLGANIVTQIVALLRGIIVAKLLGPAIYGIWHGLGLILDYSPYCGLGLVNAMVREYPYFMGKQDYQRAEQIKNTAFSMNLLLCLLFSFILISVALFFKHRYSPLVVMGLVVIAWVSLLQQMNMFFRELARIKKRIDWVNKILLCFSLVDCFLSIALVIRYGLVGLYFALLAAYLITIAYILCKSGLHFQFNINWRMAVMLLKIGIPLVLIPLLSMMLLSLDRLMILKFLGAKLLGYYGLGTMLTGFILFLPIALQFVSYPHLLEEYARSKNITWLINKYVVSPSILLAHILSILIGVVLLTIHLPIRHFLPRYLVAVTAIKILIIGAFSFSLVYLPVNFLVARNKQGKVLAIQASCILLNGCLNYLLIANGLGIAGVALATSFSYLVLAIVIMGYALREELSPALKIAGTIIRFYLPLSYILVLALVINRFLPPGQLEFLADIRFTGLKLLVFLIFSLPLLLMRQKSLQVAQMGTD